MNITHHLFKRKWRFEDGAILSADKKENVFHKDNGPAVSALPDTLQALAGMLKAYAPKALQSEAENPGGLHSAVRDALAALRKAGCTITE